MVTKASALASWVLKFGTVCTAAVKMLGSGTLGVGAVMQVHGVQST